MSERGQIALQIGIVALVMLAAVYGIVASSRSETPPITVASAGPDASLIASTVRTPSPSPSASPPASPAPSAAVPTPTPTRRPLATRPYAFGGRAYTGVDAGRGWTVLAPIDGRVEIHVYQLIGGEIREGTDVAGIPSYPYLVITALDGRKLTYRPGALGADAELLARSSQVRAGDELFRLIGDGPSSWHDFYDQSITFQVVVSLVSAAGADLDVSSLIRTR